MHHPCITQLAIENRGVPAEGNRFDAYRLVERNVGPPLFGDRELRKAIAYR